MKFDCLAVVALLVGFGSVPLSPSPAAAKSDPPKTHASRKIPPKERESGEAAKMARLLDSTGYSYVKRKPNVWSIAFQGKSLGKSVVVVALTPKLIVLFAIVSPGTAIEKAPQLMQALLRANSTFDYVKIGFDHDGALFVRLDAPARLTDARQLKTDIEQVMRASDEVSGQIAPYIKH